MTSPNSLPQPEQNSPQGETPAWLGPDAQKFADIINANIHNAATEQQADASAQEPASAESDPEPATDNSAEVDPEPEQDADAARRAKSYDLAGEAAARVSVHGADAEPEARSTANTSTSRRAARKAAKEARRADREAGDDGSESTHAAWNDRRRGRRGEGKRGRSSGTERQDRNTRNQDLENEGAPYREIAEEIGRGADESAEEYANRRAAAQAAPGNAQRETTPHAVPNIDDDAAPVRSAPPTTTAEAPVRPSPAPRGRRDSSPVPAEATPAAAPGEIEEVEVPAGMDSNTYEEMIRRAEAAEAAERKSAQGESNDETERDSPMAAWRAKRRAARANRAVGEDDRFTYEEDENESALDDPEGDYADPDAMDRDTEPVPPRARAEDDPTDDEDIDGDQEYDDTDAAEADRPSRARRFGAFLMAMGKEAVWSAKAGKNEVNPRVARRNPSRTEAVDTDDEVDNEPGVAEEGPQGPRHRKAAFAGAREKLSALNDMAGAAINRAKSYATDSKEYFNDEEKGRKRKIVAGVIGVVAAGAGAYLIFNGHDLSSGTSEAAATAGGPELNPDTFGSDVFGSPDVQSPDADVSPLGPVEAPQADIANGFDNSPNADLQTQPGAVGGTVELSQFGAQDTVSEATLDYYRELGYEMPDGHAREVINDLSQRVVDYNGFGGRETQLPVGQNVNFPGRAILEQWLAEATQKATK